MWVPSRPPNERQAGRACHNNASNSCKTVGQHGLESRSVYPIAIPQCHDCSSLLFCLLARVGSPNPSVY